MSTLKENYPLFGRKIRASSIVFPFGVGAMMDLQEGVFMTSSCDYWNSKNLSIIHDERLEKVLKVEGFKSPVNRDKDDNLNKIFIPLVKFPRWMFCPKCRSFKPLEDWEKQYKILYGKEYVMQKNICPKCKVKLSPARIVTVCEEGHIDDFPWIQWVHYKNHKKICEKPEIYIKTSGVSSGLEGITIECKTCNIKSNLSNIFDKSKNVFKILEEKAKEEGILNEDYLLNCNGNRPWDGENDKCLLYPTALQRGATNIYFPKVESSILIPPYSDKINIMIEESATYNALLITLHSLKQCNTDNDVIKNIIDNSYENIRKEISVNKNVDISIIKKIVDRKLLNDEVIVEENKYESRTKYKEEEYKALIGEFGYDISDQQDFKIEEVEGCKYNKDYIDKIVLIHKMKEVRAFIGFSRINAPDNNIMEVDDNNTSKLIRPLKNKSWYPAIEVKGEGIFIKINEDVINSWIESDVEIDKRAKELDKKYNKILSLREHSSRNISSKFLFLHTLSHIIIKELSFKCGYSSTSLRERVYCNELESDYHMSGILIYTANGDSEGTLGGLVRQGREDKLPQIIDSAIEKARLCSSDPVCSESRGQGRDALNLSACYSCTLVSETSCEEFNTLLDRAMLVGTLDKPELGFFNYLGYN